MIIKWVGSLCIMVSCGGMGISLAYKQLRDLKLVEQFLRILERMESEIRYHLRPIPGLFRIVSQEEKGCLGNLFYRTAVELDNQIQPDVESNYAYYPIVIDQEVYGHTRDELFAFLEANGIRSRKYFYPAINDCDVFKGMYDPNDTPVALSISKRVLTLPLYADLPLDVVDRICDLIMSFAKN